MKARVIPSNKPKKKDPNRRQKNLNDQLNDFMEVWGAPELIQFLKDILPFFELYDVDDHDDWVEKKVGKEDTQNVRLARTIYLLSKFCAHHSGRMARTNCEFKDLWIKMEKVHDEILKSESQTKENICSNE
jgi:hypothetical protein